MAIASWRSLALREVNKSKVVATEISGVERVFYLFFKEGKY